MRSARLYMLIVSLVLATPLVAQQPAPLSLDRALELAAQNNPEIRAAVRRVSVSEAKVPGAGALDDPMFQYRNWGTPLRQPWDWNQSQHMFMVQQTFPGAGKRAARSEIAGDEVEAAKADLAAMRQEVAARVRSAFADLLRNRDELRFHQDQDTILQQALQSALAKYTVGKAPQQDVLKAQIAQTRLADHLIALEQQRDLAQAELNTLLGRDPASELSIAGEYATRGSLPGLVDLETVAIASRPELAALRQQMESTQAQRRAAELDKHKPDFTVGLGYMLMPGGAANRNAYMAEVGINLPWLNRRKHDAEIGEAVAATEMNRALLDAQKSAVFLAIQQALVNAAAAQKSLKLYRDTLLPQTESTFKAAAAAYQNNQADFLSLVDAENMMLEVRTAYAKSAADFDHRLAELQRAIGAPIPDAAATPAPEVKP